MTVPMSMVKQETLRASSFHSNDESNLTADTAIDEVDINGQTALFRAILQVTAGSLNTANLSFSIQAYSQQPILMPDTRLAHVCLDIYRM